MYKTTMTNPLLSYLSNFKAEKGGKITHTRIGDKKLNIYGGSVTIFQMKSIWNSWNSTIVVLSKAEMKNTSQKRPPRGQEGLNYSLTPNLILFCELKPHTNF